MCGIAGFESRGAEAETTSRLADALFRRGPDASRTERKGGYSFVQTRLAIIDLSERVQYPMSNEDGTLWLLYNGEIYNFRDLGRELVRRGHRFQTDCDAEVVLHAYEEWGLNAFKRLNGMFALALFDESTGDLVLARDRLGIKPLVRTTGQRFAFASDAVALIEAGLSRGEIDMSALREYVTFHYVPPPKTGIRDIAQVAPGTAVVRAGDGTETVVSWAPPPFSERKDSSQIDLQSADVILAAAVQRQLVADVSVGVFLSGGIDSSLVLAYAVQAGVRPETFTIAFTGHGDYNEQPRAATVARALAVPHYSETFATSFVDAIDGIVAAFDQPFADSSALATLAVSRLARRHVTVALSGTGGDDLFGGYYRHRAHRFRPMLRYLSPGPLRLLQSVGVRPGAERKNILTLAGSYARRLQTAGFSSDLSQYLALVGSATSPPGLHALSFVVDPRVVRTGIAIRHGLDNKTQSRLRQIQQFELRTYLPGDLLTKEDRAAMAFGLEARVPLLDDEVVRLAASLSDEQKATLFRGKILLRDLARRRMGAPAYGLRKRGFAVPLAQLFRGHWRAQAEEWFSDSPSSLIDGQKIARLIRNDEASAQDLWALAMLARWDARVREASKTSQAMVARS